MSEENKGESKIHPIMIDASVFTSEKHCQALLGTKEQFQVSRTLYDLMLGEKRFESVSDPLLYTLDRFSWKRLEYIPTEIMNLRTRIEPYKYKEKYVKEIYPSYEKSILPWEVKDIILDEFSFLKEHSSILMSTKKFVRQLHRWGIVLIDASNKVFDQKKDLFERIRGVRWLMGLATSATSATQLAEGHVIGSAISVGATFIILMDP